MAVGTSIENWIFAGSYSHAMRYAMDQGVFRWRYATRDGFRGVTLDGRHTVYILATFDDEDLERELRWQLTPPAVLPPRVIDLRDTPEFSDIPDLTDPAAVEAWLDA